MSAPFFILNIFRYQNVFVTKRGSSTKCFATEKETISKHSCDAHTLFSLTFFPSEKISETQKGSLTKSSGTVKQNSCTENLDPLPPLCMKNFWTRFLLKRWRVPYELFRYRETKNLRTIVMPTHFLFLNFFPRKKLSETQKGSPTKCFGTVIQNISTENGDTRPPPMHEIFWYEIFSQLQKGFPAKFSPLWGKKVAGGNL